MKESQAQHLSLCVLISCMHENVSIIERTKVQTNVVVVNQCDVDSIEKSSFINSKGEICEVMFICTTERGLSKSRNMAIKNCDSDICLICDDDEILSDDYEKLIIDAYNQYPNAGFLTFPFHRIDKPAYFSDKYSKIGFKDIMKTASIQITFKRELVSKYSLFFDEKLGSGTGNGGGEENKFLLDYYKKNVKMYYVPQYIATLDQGVSLWRNGFTKEYFKNWGWSIRRIMGPWLGGLYIVYISIFKHNMYSSTISFFSAFKNLVTGFFEKR